MKKYRSTYIQTPFRSIRVPMRRPRLAKFPFFYWRSLTFVALVASALAFGWFSLTLATGEFGAAMFESYLEHPAILALNLAPPVVLIILLWFLCGVAWPAYLITGGLVLGLSMANYFKMMYRNDSVTAGDIKLAAEGFRMANEYVNEIDPRMIWAVVLFLLGGGLIAFVCRAKAAETWKARAAGSLVLGVLLLNGLYLFYWGGMYTKPAWNQWTKNEEQINQWSSTQLYLSKGFIYPFLHSVPESIEKRPEGYQKAKAEAIIAEHPDVNIPETQKVHIMSIMLEGFTDLTRMMEIEFREDKKNPYKPFHDLEKVSYTGRLITNIFAAGTVNTERTYLTGMTDFGNLRHPIWSYARYFADQGYFVQGGHPGNNWFYNRQNINEYLGFSRYHFLEDYYNTFNEGKIPMDEIFIPELYKLFVEDMKQGDPVFSFNVTYQNHGPYPIGWLRYGEFVPKGTYTEDAYYILNNYLGGVEKTGKELIRLKKKLEKLEEPVVLMVFGDHNPWLGDNNSVYNEVGVNFNLDTIQGFKNYYGTRYLIWANDAAKEALGFDFVGKGPDLGPYFLMTHFFDLCGWEGPTLAQLSRPLMKDVPIINDQGIFVYKNQMIQTLPERLQPAWQAYEMVSYYLRNDLHITNKKQTEQKK